MDKFKNINTADLIKKEKTTRVLTSMLIGMLAVLLVISIVNAVNGKSFATIAVPFALSTIVFVNIRNAKEMKAEIISRQNKTNSETIL